MGSSKISAKDLSLKSKMFAIVVVIIAMIVKFIFKVDWVSVGEILAVGGFIVAAFGDVSVSKWLEKKYRGNA